MGCDLRCHNCGDNLGKDKENTVDAWCGNCDTAVFNPDGYIEDAEHLEIVKKKWPGRKLPKPDN